MQIYPTKDFLKKIRQTYIFFYLLLGIKIRFHGVRMIFLRTTSFEVFKIEAGKNVEKLIFWEKIPKNKKKYIEIYMYIFPV